MLFFDCILFYNIIFFHKNNISRKMRQINWHQIGPKVCQLAEEAGEYIMKNYREANDNSVQLSCKSDNSPLTRADLASHHSIVEGLAQLTPDIPVVSEEDNDSQPYRLNHQQFWLVDPLDGTKEFLARNGEFTVNIALIEGGVAAWGVVYAPALRRMFWGGHTHGAFRQAKGQKSKLHVASAGHSGPYRVVVSKSHLNTETAEFISKLGSTKLVQAGSSLKFCLIAEGCADVYPRLAPTCEWDTAAAQAVLEGAGGHVYDTTGQRLRYGKPDVLNPNFIASSMPFDILLGER